MLAPLLALFFAAVFAASLGAVYWLSGRNTATPPPASREPAGGGGGREEWSPLLDSPLLKDESLSTISFWSRLLEQVDGVRLLQRRLDEAGLRWSVGRLTAMMLLAAAATGVLLNTFTFVPRFVVLAASAAAGFGPYWVVARRRTRRLRKFEEQFPDALDSLARCLRAGNTVAAGLELLAREAPQPLAQEFRRTADERGLGMPMDQALANLATRIPVAEVSLFVAAIQLQSRTGGKLHEVLSRLAETMRESGALKSEVRSIAAHGRLTGAMLTALPIGIALMTAWVNPGHVLILWTNETGRDMLFAALICLVLAHVVIGKLVDIKI
jgi:tight adherence protein B